MVNSSGWTEGDSADYSFEVVHYSDVGYIDALQNEDNEKSDFR